MSRVADGEPVAEELVVDLGYTGLVVRGDHAQPVVELGKNVDDLGPGWKAKRAASPLPSLGRRPCR